MSNNFNGSTVNKSDISTETTQSKVLEKLNTGLVISTTSAIDIQTNPLTDKVQVAINSADQIGNLDIDIVAQSLANLNINQTQINGIATKTSNGTHTDALRVVIANDTASISIKNPNSLFSSQWINEATDPFNLTDWSLNTNSGGTMTPSFNTVDRALNLSYVNDVGAIDFDMISNRKFNCIGTSNRLIITMALISFDTGHLNTEYIRCGFFDKAFSNFGFYIEMNGDQTYKLGYSTNGATIIVQQGSWNVNTTVLSQRDNGTNSHTINWYFGWNNNVIEWGEYINGNVRLFHQIYSDAVNPRNFPTNNELPVTIDAQLSNAMELRIMSVSIIQDYIKVNQKDSGNYTKDTQRIVISNNQPVYNRTYLNEFLKDSALFNMNLNYTGGGIGSKDYIYTSVSDNTYITRIIFYLNDGNSTIRFERFGGINPALPNGLQLFTDDGTKTYITDPNVTIKSNAEFTMYGYDMTLLTGTTGTHGVVAKLDLNREGIRLLNGVKFGIQLDDDLTGLNQFYVNISGYTS